MTRAPRTNVHRWAILGMGEVAASLLNAGLLQAHPQVAIVLLYERRPSPATLRRLAEVGLPYTQDSSAIGDVDMVLSAVTPDAALDVARRVAPYLQAQAIYVDLNSIAAPTAVEIGQAVERAGGRFVDAAIMGPVPLLKLQAPIALSGSAAHDFHAWATQAGLNTSVLSDTPGDASALKMLWSVVTKGTIALYAEALVGAHRLGLLEPMQVLLAQEYGRTGSSEMIVRLLRSTTVSGDRRLAEMREAEKTLEMIAVPPWTVEATQRWIAALAQLKQPRTTQTVADVVAAISTEIGDVEVACSLA